MYVWAFDDITEVRVGRGEGRGGGTATYTNRCAVLSGGEGRRGEERSWRLFVGCDGVLCGILVLFMYGVM